MHLYGGEPNEPIDICIKLFQVGKFHYHGEDILSSCFNSYTFESQIMFSIVSGSERWAVGLAYSEWHPCASTVRLVLCTPLGGIKPPERGNAS